ncbi:MAG: 1-acyl-sn-glycerol-3-phosphate acyltransferase [Crocinitomicaceae bacterium]
MRIQRLQITILPSIMLYRILKILLGTGIWLYYREVRVKHRERLIQKGPTIIIANHPNTLMDAWIIAGLCKRPIYYMAKGTFFNTPLKRWFLKGLGLIPVNRSVDNRTAGVSNQQAFEACYEVLEKGDTLLIFPEGNSSLERQLRELKTGAARIALEAETRNGGKLGIKIVPIGLIYVQGEQFRSSVLANIGETIDPSHHYDEYQLHPSPTGKKLTEKFRASLEGLLVNSISKDQEDFVDAIVEVLSSEEQNQSIRGVESEVELMKNVHAALNRIYLDTPGELTKIELLVYRLKWQLEKMEIDPKLLSRKLKRGMFIRQLMESISILFLGLPIFFIGVIHNFFPFKLTGFLMPILVKDVEYYAPIAILLGIVLYPLTYIGFLFLVDYLFEWEWWVNIIYFAAMPISGMIAYYFLRYIGQVSFKWNYLLLLSGKRELLKSLRSDKERLKRSLFNPEFDQ